MTQTSLLDPLDIALGLMRIDSTTGREAEVVSMVHSLLESGGWRVRRIPVSPGRDAIHATGHLEGAVTLSTHLDTVPPYLPPSVDGDRLLGRGACDAKGIAAAMICAGDRLRLNGFPVGLLFVVGEEATHDGAIAANRDPAATHSRALINGEPTESRLAIGTKGALRVTLRTRGVAAHSAYPELGHSAIDDLVSLLHELRSLDLPSDPLLGSTTVNVGHITGGVADNVIAPEAEARIMLRTVTPNEQIVELLTRWADGRAELEPSIAVPPIHLGTVPGFDTAVMAYATDIPELGAWGTPYLFGPGSIHVAHRDDEFLSIGELRAAVGKYEGLAISALGARELRLNHRFVVLPSAERRAPSAGFFSPPPRPFPDPPSGS